MRITRSAHMDVVDVTAHRLPSGMDRARNDDPTPPNRPAPVLPPKPYQPGPTPPVRPPAPYHPTTPTPPVRPPAPYRPPQPPPQPPAKPPDEERGEPM